MFTAAGFTTAKRWKSVAIDRQWINAMWSTRTLEYYSAMKRGEALTPQHRRTLNTWCSVREARPKSHTVCVIPCMCHVQNKHIIEAESGLVVDRDWERGVG